MYGKQDNPGQLGKVGLASPSVQPVAGNDGVRFGTSALGGVIGALAGSVVPGIGTLAGMQAGMAIGGAAGGLMGGDASGVPGAANAADDLVQKYGLGGM